MRTSDLTNKSQPFQQQQFDKDLQYKCIKCPLRSNNLCPLGAENLMQFCLKRVETKLLFTILPEDTLHWQTPCKIFWQNFCFNKTSDPEVLRYIYSVFRPFEIWMPNTMVSQTLQLQIYINHRSYYVWPRHYWLESVYCFWCKIKNILTFDTHYV